MGCKKYYMVVILINLARVVFEMRPFETNGGSHIGSHIGSHME